MIVKVTQYVIRTKAIKECEIRRFRERRTVKGGDLEKEKCGFGWWERERERERGWPMGSPSQNLTQLAYTIFNPPLHLPSKLIYKG